MTDFEIDRRLLLTGSLGLAASAVISPDANATVPAVPIAPARSLSTGRHITVNGARLWVEQEGAGEPIVIIPGGPGASQLNFHPWFSRLAATNRVIYFDAFGRGRSDRPRAPAEYSFDRDVRDLEGLRQALGLQRMNVYGFSYGGMVAQAYALRYPTRLGRLVLANTLHSAAMWQAKNENILDAIRNQYPDVAAKLDAFREAGVPSGANEVLAADETPYALSWFYTPQNEDKLQSAPGSFNADVYRAIGGMDVDRKVGGDAAALDFRPKLKTLKMPILIIAGRFDRVLTPRWTEQFKTYCPQAKFVMFEKSGHYPQIEETDTWAEVVNTFLAARI
jgi:proline iminopeptidase